MTSLIYFVWILIGAIWGRYAVKKQIELKDDPFYILICAIMNVFLWPIGMFVAWKRGLLFSGEKNKP